jgi:hypothetical protein
MGDRQGRAGNDQRARLSLLYLTREQVAGLLPEIRVQLDLVEGTYAALAAGRVELPPKPGVHPRENSFIHAMPAYLADQDVAALKWVSGYPGNKARGLPYISGLLVLNDAETGLPLAVMDAAGTAASAKPQATRRGAARTPSFSLSGAPLATVLAPNSICLQSGLERAGDDIAALSAAGARAALATMTSG